jgi:hypothetical protein
MVRGRIYYEIATQEAFSYENKNTKTDDNNINSNKHSHTGPRTWTHWKMRGLRTWTDSNMTGLELRFENDRASNFDTFEYDRASNFDTLEDDSLLGFAPCSLVEVDRSFRGVYLLHHRGTDSLQYRLALSFLLSLL